jgi:hypothetical protein
VTAFLERGQRSRTTPPPKPAQSGQFSSTHSLGT